MKNKIASMTRCRMCRPKRWSASVGRISAYTTSILLIAYVITTLLGFASLESADDQIEDPYFSLMEVFILLIMPFMMMTMVDFHQWATPAKQIFSLGALGFIAVCVGITSSVHFVVWTVGQPISDQVENAQYLFSFSWPSVAYALDILAWDWFFGLSMILGAFVVDWTTKIQKLLRMLMIISGVLSVLGLIAVPLDNMQVRIIGIVGYAFITIPVFAIMGVLLGHPKPEEIEHSGEMKGDSFSKEVCEETVDHDEGAVLSE